MLDQAEIPIKCATCAHETPKTVAWLKDNDHLICACGSRIDINAGEFLQDLDQAQKALDDFVRSSTKTIKIRF